MISPKTDIISCAEAQTLPELFALRVKRTPQSPAYHQFEADSKKWRSYSWQDMGVLVARWKRALAQENLGPGERVAILLRNSVEWVCFDQASMALGLVVVPLYPSDAPDNIAYILENSGARLLLLPTQRRWQTLAPLCENLSGLDKILCVERPNGDAGRKRVEGLDEWLARPDQLNIAPANYNPDKHSDTRPDRIDIDELHPSDPQAIATLVYTSGTTGRPKGVMLSHRNILWDAEATLQVISGYPEDVYLSLLPLSHMLERTVGYYVPLMAGSSVAYARSLKDLPEDLKTIQPRIFVAVPQIYAGIRNKMLQQVHERGRLAELLLNWTVAIGWARFNTLQGQGKSQGESPFWHALAWPMLKHFVAHRILAVFGGSLRLAVSGGGPLYPEIAKFFIGLGLPLLQGYGLTESSPVLTANRVNDNVPESTGKALPGVELRFGDQDELLARSPGVMLGYWNRPEDTRAVIDEEGWLHTGDQARIVDGRVFISGRIKEILVTSSGEKVPPGDLEMSITQDPLFHQVMVVGEGRPHLVALVVLNRREWDALAVTLNLNPDDPGSLKNSAARAAALKKIKATLGGFPKYARVRSVHMTLEPWSMENGLLTPTLKLKRPVMEKRFAEQIDELYKKE
jgi:long-chain acyl-CoA synthetase